MVLSKMSFSGVSFEYNPVYLKLESRRLLAQSFMPFIGEKTQDLGRKCTVVSGRGELFGADAFERYERLSKLFGKGKKGILSLPGLSPMYARFTRLEAVGETTPDLVTYSFEFCEDASEETAQNKTYICRQGETLFDIAFITDTTVDKLVALNPWVKRPDEIEKGREVRLC
ncbi:MAG: LysM peptidoglycan-binding domain-containing protein [Ruminococcus sp.]